MSSFKKHCVAVLVASQLIIIEVHGADATPGWPAANGSAERGATRSTELYCTVCHGAAGSSVTPEWPSLAGQRAGYIAEQLLLFRAGRRASAEMAPLAASLTDDDIADLASYFSAQLTAPAISPANTSDGDGRRLFRDGDAARGLAACASCHGKDGNGDSVLRAPALRAQQSVYAVQQLQNFAQRRRYPRDPPPQADAMSLIAIKLQPQEMTAVAAWLQRQP